jgi:two-component system sensor histidine kinase VicK
MGGRKTRDFWRNERLGLAMIGASVTVIGVIIALMFAQQRDAADARVRAEATSITRLLAALPYEQLLPSAGPRGLEALANSQPADVLAYASITDSAGTTLDQMVRPGITIPAPAVADSTASAFGERIVMVGGSRDDARPLIEFQSPLVAEGHAAGHIRLGYFQPPTGLKLAQIPFFGSLALAVFLLTPIFYFLVRSEIRPISNITAEIDKILQSGSFERIRLNASGTVNAFLERFNSFADFAQARLRDVTAENTRLLTSAKLLGYQKQRLERLLEALPDAVLLLDESGTVTFANSKLRGLFGVAPEEVIGRNPDDWCKDRKIVDFINRFEGTSVARQLTRSVEFSPAGSPDKIFSLRLWPLLSTQGASGRIGTLLVFRDVTTESLAARSRGEFVAHLAHELKTPLNVLAMYTETLQDDRPSNEAERIDAVNAISDEVQRLAGLIDNLLNITRIEMGSLKLERQRVNLKDLLQDAFDHVARSGREKGLKFSIEVPENLAAASVDKSLLRVALNNLLTNAIKYSNSGGTVTMGAEETSDLIRIYVSDTGIGIKPEDCERIFDKFFRADDEQTRSRSGHGLGLALARDIVQLHHGTIRVESELGTGSRFSIELWKDTVSLQQAS